MVGSLFSQHLMMSYQDDLRLSLLIAPPALPEERPSLPESVKSRPKQYKAPQHFVRKQNILRIEESPRQVPDFTSTKPELAESRPDVPFRLGSTDREGENSPTDASLGRGCNVDCGETGIGRPVQNASPILKSDAGTVLVAEPPPIKQPAVPPVKSGGVVNGLAKELVMPGYPAAAKAMKISGRVTVQVLIDEAGNVIAAQAVDGHILLRRPAVDAARLSKFTATRLSGIPVKVRGKIIYNFRP